MRWDVPFNICISLLSNTAELHLLIPALENLMIRPLQCAKHVLSVLPLKRLAGEMFESTDKQVREEWTRVIGAKYRTLRDCLGVRRVIPSPVLRTDAATRPRVKEECLCLWDWLEKAVVWV